jgi:nucleoid DNA-binding protein
MNPKKANKLYKPVAEELHVEESLVEDLVEFMYKTLRQNLSGLTHPRINLDGLGHFTARPFSVRRGIESANKVLSNHDTSTFSAYHNKKQLDVKVKALTKLEEMIAAEDQRKQEFKTKKNETNN